jgi:D-galactarolactone cycloisomerase
MKIRSLEAVPLRYVIPGGAYGSARGLVRARTTCLVRVVTEDGVTGVGEAFGPPRVIAAHVEELAPLFVGQDPFDHEACVARALSGRYHCGRTGLHVAAVSGIELACWDVMGKVVGMPVAKLLGGWNRDEVVAYASTGYFSEERGRFEAFIEAAVAEGFRHIKIKCGAGLESDLERVETVRRLAGEDVEIMVDLNGNYTADLVLQLARELDGYRVGWLEEPVPPEDLPGYARIRQGCRLPIATGEAEALRTGFRDLISHRLIDVVQPDVTACGGLTEAKAIVRMAQAWNIRFSPHVWGGAVSLAASLQLCAAIPPYPHVEREPEPLLFEYDRGPNGLRDDLFATPLEIVGDRITIPQRPGLGIELDWSAVERYRIDREG